MDMIQESRCDPTVLVLSGGVGGAKLVRGLGRLLNGLSLRVVVNTGDDFDCQGLRVCPDLDTVMYALSGLQHESRGWGIEGDTWNALEMMGHYKMDTWFQLGDRDLATHILRTSLLREGLSLSEVTKRLSRALGITAHLYPMTDDQVRTMVRTSCGELMFQDYFVRQRTRPNVLGVRFDGIETARPSLGLLESIDRADLIIIAPSNPVVSISPILALPGIRERLHTARAAKVAVSPVVAGRALKGPTVKMLQALGVSPTALGVAEQYVDIIDILVLDRRDSGFVHDVQAMGMTTVVTNIVMSAEEGKIRLAKEILDLVGARTNGV